MSRRVVVTGIGVICAVGHNTEEVWSALLAGKSGVERITGFDASQFACQIAAEVKNFDPLQFVEKKEARKMARFIHLAIAASDEALRMANYKVENEDMAERTGVNIGSGIGGFDIIEREHSNLLNGGPRKISPFFIPAAIVNLAAGQVSIRNNAKGPNEATCTACTTSAHSIGDAARVIKYGDADVMIAGGTEAAITPMGVGGFAAMRALSTRNDDPHRASRPWDKDRDGFVIGEGSGILILEELEFARKRGAKIIAEVVGYGMSADANHITQPAPEGEGGYRVMRNAMRDAGHFTRADRLRQRTRHLHSAGRRVGGHGHQARLRRSRLQDAGQLDQVDDRASAGRRWRIGSRDHRAGAARSDRPADRQSRQPRRGLRSRLRAPHFPPGHAWITPCRTRSASAAPTAASSSSAGRNRTAPSCCPLYGAF